VLFTHLRQCGEPLAADASRMHAATDECQLGQTALQRWRVGLCMRFGYLAGCKAFDRRERWLGVDAGLLPQSTNGHHATHTREP
jgi:hypothetical protein